MFLVMWREEGSYDENEEKEGWNEVEMKLRKLESGARSSAEERGWGIGLVECVFDDR